MENPQGLKKIDFAIAVCILLYIFYIIFRLDTVGGFFERNEVVIKSFLSAIILICSIFGIKYKKNNKLWVVGYLMLSLLSVISILVVYGFRHGIGF